MCEAGDELHQHRRAVARGGGNGMPEGHGRPFLQLHNSITAIVAPAAPMPWAAAHSPPESPLTKLSIIPMPQPHHHPICRSVTPRSPCARGSLRIPPSAPAPDQDTSRTPPTAGALVPARRSVLLPNSALSGRRRQTDAPLALATDRAA